MDSCANIINAENDDSIRTLLSADAIRESSQKLSKIVKLIEDIASKTNLPPSNAAEEATRAIKSDGDAKDTVI